MTISKLLLASCLLLGACVTTPTDTATVASRSDAISVSGYASKSRASLRVYAWHHGDQQWHMVRSLLGGASSIGTTKLYGWTTSNLTLSSGYWVPPGGGCGDSGMARLQVRELIDGAWRALATFDPAGKECLFDELRDGTDPFDAGLTCRTGDQIVLFAPPEC